MSTNETTWTQESLFNRERFEAWLTGLAESRTINYRSVEDCVVCSFIKETTSAQLPYTGSNDVSIIQGVWRENFRMPQWLDNLLDDMRQCGEPSTALTKKSILAAYLKQFPESTPVIEPVEVKGVAV